MKDTTKVADKKWLHHKLASVPVLVTVTAQCMVTVLVAVLVTNANQGWYGYLCTLQT